MVISWGNSRKLFWMTFWSGYFLVDLTDGLIGIRRILLWLSCGIPKPAPPSVFDFLSIYTRLGGKCDKKLQKYLILCFTTKKQPESEKRIIKCRKNPLWFIFGVKTDRKAVKILSIWIIVGNKCSDLCEKLTKNHWHSYQIRL